MKSALRLLLTLFTILCGTTISSASIQELHEGVGFEKSHGLEVETRFHAEFFAPKSVVPPSNPKQYSTAFEMKLNPKDLGRSDKVHFNRANKALDEAMSANPQLAQQMDNLIPGVQSSVSSVGGRANPSGWTWHHTTISEGGSAGVMRLVPTPQHTPGSSFWRVLHPNKGGAGGYSEWALPAGAPKR